MIDQGATTKPTRSAGAIDFENEPQWITFCRVANAWIARGRLPSHTRSE